MASVSVQTVPTKMCVRDVRRLVSDVARVTVLRRITGSNCVLVNYKILSVSELLEQEKKIDKICGFSSGI
jgi:hypothetical protein